MVQQILCTKCKSQDIEETGYSMRDLISWYKCNNCDTDMVVEYDLVIKEIREIEFKTFQ